MIKRLTPHLEAALSSIILTASLAALLIWLMRDGWVRQWSDAPPPPTQTTAPPPLSQPLQVMLTSSQRILANVGVEPVRRRPSQSTLRALGRVAVDESTRFQVTARTEGRLDRLWVKQTGDVVGAGQRIASLYSPELLSAQEVFLTARSKPGTAAAPLVEQAKKRLSLLGMSNSAISRLERDAVAAPLVDVHSQNAGTVAKVLAQQGQYVMQGDPILDLVDLSTVWVEAEIFTSDLPLVPLGTQASILAQGLAPDTLTPSATAEVNFIYPYLDAEKRTTRVRLSLPNANGQLRPDQYVDVSFAVPTGPPEVIVPASAVILTGGYPRVWVETQPNVFEVRLLRLGTRTPNGFVVLSGLREDEQVLIKGVFLIDSQATLEQPAAFQALVEGRHPLHRPGGTVRQPGAVLGDTTTCPVMGSTFVVKETSPRAEYNGSTIYFCCGGCDKKFLANPKQFLPSIK